MLCTEATFVKKNSCFVARIVSFDTVKSVKFNIFELGIFSFNLYVYYLTRGFLASTRAFYLLTRAFNLATRAFSLLTRGFELVTYGSELVTRGFEFVTREFELVTRGFELLTPNSCFTFPLFSNANKAIARELLAILVSRVLSKIFSWLVQLTDLAKVIFATKKNFFVHSKLFTPNFASKKTPKVFS